MLYWLQAWSRFEFTTIVVIGTDCTGSCRLLNFLLDQIWFETHVSLLRRVWRYQREVIGIRLSKKNRQYNAQKKKYKRRSTKHTHKTKDRVTRTPLKIGGELKCSERVGSSCSPSGTHRVSLVKKHWKQIAQKSIFRWNWLYIRTF